MSYISPDRLYSVPVDNGILHISPSMDFLHFFPPLGAYMLKYYDVDHVPPRMCNVMMNEDSARFLMENCKVEVIFRESMGVQEHEQLLTWQASQLSDSAFDFEFPPDAA